MHNMVHGSKGSHPGWGRQPTGQDKVLGMLRAPPARAGKGRILRSRGERRRKPPVALDGLRADLGQGPQAQGPDCIAQPRVTQLGSPMGIIPTLAGHGGSVDGVTGGASRPS